MEATPNGSLPSFAAKQESGGQAMPNQGEKCMEAEQTHTDDDNPDVRLMHDWQLVMSHIAVVVGGSGEAALLVCGTDYDGHLGRGRQAHDSVTDLPVHPSAVRLLPHGQGKAPSGLAEQHTTQFVTQRLLRQTGS